MRILEWIGKLLVGTLIARLVALALVASIIVLLNYAKGIQSPEIFFLVLLVFAFLLLLVYRRMSMRSASKYYALLGVIGGAFLVFIGLWSFLSPRSFESCAGLFCTVFRHLPQYSYELLVMLPGGTFGAATVWRSLRSFSNGQP